MPAKSQMEEEAERITKRIDARDPKSEIAEDIKKVWGLGEGRIYPNRVVRADANETRSESHEADLQTSFLAEGVVDDRLTPWSHMEEHVS